MMKLWGALAFFLAMVGAVGAQSVPTGSNTAPGCVISGSTITCGTSSLTPASSTLTNTHIYVGNGSNVATDVALSGDATMANTGAITFATVNGNVGTFGSATQSVQFTVNAKGLMTAAANATVTPAVGSITGLGSGVATWLATPSSANLAAAVTGETGTGALVFADTPTLITPNIGVATGTSLSLASAAFIVGATGTLTATNPAIKFTGLGTDAAVTSTTACILTDGTLAKGSGTVGICLGTSSLRYKQSVEPIAYSLPYIMELKPVSYVYRDGHGDNGARRQNGFLAEDMVDVLPMLVGRDIEGRPNTVDMAGLIPEIVRAIQELKMDNDHLRAMIEDRRAARQ